MKLTDEQKAHLVTRIHAIGLDAALDECEKETGIRAQIGNVTVEAVKIHADGRLEDRGRVAFSSQDPEQMEAWRAERRAFGEENPSSTITIGARA